MIVLLGGLVFAFIMIGFTLIGAIPLLFGVLGYAVFREQRDRTALAAAPEADVVALPMPQGPHGQLVQAAARDGEPTTAEAATADAAEADEAEAAKRETPRVMAAGRRRPLP